MNRRFVFTFAILQAIGAIGWLTNAAAPESLGKPLWVLGFVAMLPGNLIAPGLVEELLWSSPASLTTISVASLAGSILVNLALAALLFWGLRRMQRAA